MPSDIVFPDGKELDFIAKAKLLGYTKLFFVYKKKTNFSHPGFSIQCCLISEPRDVLKAKSLSSFVIVRSSGDDRLLIERHRPNLIFDFETAQRKDFMHNRNSGLNQVHAELMSKNSIAAAFSLSSMLHSKQRSVLLGRISQNIVFCRKFHVNMVLASFAESPFEMRSSHDLAAFGTLLGMTAKEASVATEF